jgi:DNA-binding phage protein
MELNTKHHEEMLNMFVRMCPMWADDIVDCIPRSTNSIRLIFHDGSKIDFNAQTGTFRRVEQSNNSIYDYITDDDCRSVFSANLSEMMRMQGIGQATLAERTGLSSAMISKYLNQKSTPTITSVIRIARALNCQPDELYN